MPCIVMYTWSHAHCILLCTHGHTHTVYFYVHMATRTLYTSGVLRPRSAFTVRGKLEIFPWWQVKTLDAVCGQLSPETAVCRLDIRPKNDLHFTNHDESTRPRGFCTRGVSRLQTSSSSVEFLRKSMFLLVTVCVGSLANIL